MHKKRTASVLILAGTSLATIAGQAATNVSAEGGILGSIKNFFTNSKNKKEGTKVEDSLRLQKEKIVDLEKKGKLAKNEQIDLHERDKLKVLFALSFSGIVSCSALYAVINHWLTDNMLVLLSFIFLPAIGTVCYLDYIREHNSFFKEAKEARANVKGKIKEDMLNKQYTLKEFEEIVKDDEKCSEFIRQLLVLDRAPEKEANDEDYKPIGNGEVEEAKETLEKLFLEIDSVDKINDLKKLPQQDKEKLLKVVEPLLTWAYGKMPALFGEKDYFCYQKDDEFMSKVGLLCNALCYTQSTADEPKAAISCLSANGFVNFICRDDNSFEEKPYKKEYAKRSFVYYTKKYLAEHYSSDVFFSDSLLLNSAKSLFKNLKNFDLLDFNENEKDNCSSSSELAAKEFYSKFEDKNLRDAVFGEIERYLEERVEDYETEKFSNREGGEESLKERMEYVKEYLSSQQEKDSTS